jgi:hypothetical protein
MNWRTFLGAILISASAAWYYFHVRPDEQRQAIDAEKQLAARDAALADLGAGKSVTQEAGIESSEAAPTPNGYDKVEVAAMQTKSGQELANQIGKEEFRQLPPEKQMMVKEILARELAKGDGTEAGELLKQIDTGPAAESADLFEATTMSTGFGAAKVLIDLAFNATNEDVRKKALGAVSRIYKSRGNKRTVEETTKIEQYLLATLGRADLSDREFTVIIQALAGFGSLFGTQTMIDLWETSTAARQEIIGNEIKVIFQKSAVSPLSLCALTHKQLWKSCGLSLAMIGSEESIVGIFRAVAESPEKKVESLVWFQLVNKLQAIKTLLSESKKNEFKDKEYYSQVRALAEELSESIQPTKVQ